MIEMRYGRKDAEKAEDCVDEGNLPSGNKPFPDTDNAQVGYVIVLCRSRLHFDILWVPVTGHYPFGSG